MGPKIVFLLANLVAMISGIHLPPYIKTCRKDEPEFAKCMYTHLNAALPYIVQGDKEYGFPSLNPMIIPEAVVDTGKDFKLKMTNVSVYGFDTVRNINVKANFTTLETSHVYVMDKLSLVGNYEVEGKILSLDISGKGIANVTLVKPTFYLNWNMGTTIKDGVKYLTLVKADAAYDVERVIYKIDNLFNGDKESGDHMNEVLNDNWQVLHDEFGSIFSRILMGTIRNTSLKLMDSIPLDEFFP